MIVTTRIVVAIAYLGLTWYLVRSVFLLHPSMRPARWFLTFSICLWAVWYSYLAIAGPVFSEPWIVLRNVLHVPLVAAVGVTVWAGRRVQ